MSENPPASRRQLRAWAFRARTVYLKAAGLFEDMQEVLGDDDELIGAASGSVTSSVELLTMLDAMLAERESQHD